MSREARVVLGAATVLAMVTAATIALGVRSGARAGPHAVMKAGDATPGPVVADFGERVRALEAHVAGEPADTAAVVALARLLHDAHRPDEAVPHYERVLAGDATRRDLWLDLAAAHAAAGDVAGARAALSRFLAVFPSDPVGLYDLGLVEEQAHDTAAAVEWWRRAVATGDAEIAPAAHRALARVQVR